MRWDYVTAVMELLQRCNVCYKNIKPENDTRIRSKGKRIFNGCVDSLVGAEIRILFGRPAAAGVIRGQCPKIFYAAQICCGQKNLF